MSGAEQTPDREVVRAKFVEYRRTGDVTLRNDLVQAHLGLARYLARRFANRGETLDDLVQVASLALVKAVDRFEPERGLEFSTFATPTIVGEIKRHFRDKGWAVQVGRRIQELHLRVAEAVGPLTQELGRSPTIPEIARKVGASEEQVLEAIEAASAYRSVSIAGAETSEERDRPAGWAPQLAEDEEGFDHVEAGMTVVDLFQQLPPRERKILYLRFYKSMTQSQIAGQLGMSQMHVSRLIARSLEQLRAMARTQEATDS